MVFLNQRKTKIIWYHLYVESKKRIQTNLFTKQNRVTDIENKAMVWGGGDKLDDWVGPRHTVTHIIGNWQEPII